MPSIKHYNKSSIIKYMYVEKKRMFQKNMIIVHEMFLHFCFMFLKKSDAINDTTPWKC